MYNRNYGGFDYVRIHSELQDSDYESITNTFLNSDLHISELKEIDLYEVFPVLKGNLINVAGEWNGFDEKWLKDACTKAYFKRNNSFLNGKQSFIIDFCLL